MLRPTIAVDIDDVLSANAEGFVAFSNRRYGLQLVPENYSEDWRQVWQVDLAEAEQRANDFHESGVVSDYLAIAGAQSVLQSLKAEYRLIAVTSRQNRIAGRTLDWLDKHYSDIFENVLFAGIFDSKVHDAGMLKRTKVDVLQQHRASYLIDDQLKHCLAAAQAGIPSVLFGDYRWNQADSLPEGVTRCSGWAAVEEYFRGRG
jgi:uncharacterized HAD superfamily protein